MNQTELDIYNDLHEESPMPISRAVNFKMVGNSSSYHRSRDESALVEESKDYSPKRNFNRLQNEIDEVQFDLENVL